MRGGIWVLMSGKLQVCKGDMAVGEPRGAGSYGRNTTLIACEVVRSMAVSMASR